MLVTKEGDHCLARAQGLSIFTEAKSLDELKQNIREAVELHLEDGEHKRYGLPSSPKIEVAMTSPKLCESTPLFGYEVVRQRGSHVRLRTMEHGEHSITIPNHEPVHIGTLAGIIKDVAAIAKLPKTKCWLAFAERDGAADIRIATLC